MFHPSDGLQVKRRGWEFCEDGGHVAMVANSMVANSGHMGSDQTATIEALKQDQADLQYHLY